MKLLFVPLVASLGVIPVNNFFTKAEKPIVSVSHIENNKEDNVLNFQEGGPGKMSAVKFKSQEYCRVELKDFEFDAHFSITGATVYFSGANFPTVQKATITSASLKPISALMARCTAGTIVVFDDVKVVGPDKEVRTIQGISLLLY